MSGKRVHNGAELAKVLLDIEKKTEANLDDVITKLALDGWRNLVRITPVRTGFLRSRWQVGTRVQLMTEENPGGTFSGPEPPAEQFKWGDHIYLFNNAEYASHVDQGTANRKAQPMIEPTYEYLLNVAKGLTEAESRKVER